MLTPDSLHVWRDEAGDYHIKWLADAPRPSLDLQTLDLDHRPVERRFEASHEDDRVRLSGLPADDRHLFRVRDGAGREAVVGERRLAMDGTPNFRDFGGYAAADGRHVKWGSLYRSGQLSSLSDEDLALLKSLDIDLICDFRREDEQEKDPTRLPTGAQTQILSLPIIPGSNAAYFEQMGSNWDDGPEQMFAFMLDVNRDLALAQGEAYRRMFERMLNIDEARILVHCSAGKDRTGFAAAIILLALGVSHDRVMQDYLLSARYFHPHREIERLKQKYGLETLPEAAILPMLEVHEVYLNEALDSIHKQFDTLEAYLREELGVGDAEREALRARYLVGS